MKKLHSTLILCIAIFVTSSSVFAQTSAPHMTFESETHDYGKIEEEAGKQKCKFVFTNTGAEPIIIKQVKASCGCTTPDWSRQPVPPGGKGFVSAEYNPYNRPGKFNKSITVTSNAENATVSLRITGEVIPKKKSVEDDYRYKLENIRLKTSNISFGSMKSNEKKTKTVEIINISDKPVTLTFDKNPVPAHVTIKSVPETLKPNQTGKLEVTFDANKKSDWDYVNDRLNMVQNGVYNQHNRLTVSATIKEHFSKEQIANPPAMTFIGGQDFAFGTVNEGDVIEHVFKFKNTGKSDLIIRKTRTSCGCTVVEPKNKTIKPGEESEIKAVFNTRGKKNKQTKVITVITNIPGKEKHQEKSRVLIKMSGNVTPKNQQKKKK